jgi:polysaccharide pyruvyl transferase WcaK-like protein
MKFSRRTFIRSSLSVVTAGRMVPLLSAAPADRPPRILLRGSWQSVNIGDIGHTPGALRLIERHFPEAEITLWPGTLGHGSREFLLKAFPRLRIAAGSVQDGRPTTPELTSAWAENDFMLHGSGSGFGARAHLAAWHRATGKPYGVFGVSTDPISGFGGDRDPEGGTLASIRSRIEKLPATHLDDETRWIIDRASFMFTRETLSRDYLKAQGVKTPILEFGPDAQFGMHLRDDARGDAYRKAKDLEERKFICVIPRLRYTPYYRVNNTKRVASDDVKDAINDRTTEGDHAKLRDMIVAYVRNTGNKVMACAEMTYQVQMAKDVLVDPLPADVKKNVVWRDTYWLPDEAASIYSKAQAVVSVECHSPIISLTNGTPAFYVRQPTDTCKGQMYRDIGVNEWFFEVDETSGDQLWSRLKAIHSDPSAAQARVKSAMALVEQRQKRMVDALRAAVRPTI